MDSLYFREVVVLKAEPFKGRQVTNALYFVDDIVAQPQVLEPSQVL